jgi:nucleotide sugar dehydrogenase
MNVMKVCVVGVGYVGEHLVTTFSKAYNVFGYDISEARVEYLREEFKDNPKVTISNVEAGLSNAGLYCIAVPTLVKDDKTIDDSYLKKAVDTVSRYAPPGSCIVMESSVSVGMTRTLLGPLFERGDIFVGFSPERVDPGRVHPRVDEIPKIISGIDSKSLWYINTYYSAVFSKVVKVSSMETAEMCKLYENCFRMINIAYVNEIADACGLHRIDYEEMINASATKPFGFMPFKPGLGVGGHCIPVNPYYLFVNNELPLLKQATEVTLNRPVEKSDEFVKAYPDAVRICIVGVAFKPGQSLVVNSPGAMFAKTLEEKYGRTVVVYDPLVEKCDFDMLATKNWDEAYLNKNFDVIVVCMEQRGVDFSVLKYFKGVKVWF